MNPQELPAEKMMVSAELKDAASALSALPLSFKGDVRVRINVDGASYEADLLVQDGFIVWASLTNRETREGLEGEDVISEIRNSLKREGKLEIYRLSDEEFKTIIESSEKALLEDVKDLSESFGAKKKERQSQKKTEKKKDVEPEDMRQLEGEWEKLEKEWNKLDEKDRGYIEKLKNYKEEESAEEPEPAIDEPEEETPSEPAEDKEIIESAEEGIKKLEEGKDDFWEWDKKQRAMGAFKDDEEKPPEPREAPLEEIDSPLPEEEERPPEREREPEPVEQPESAPEAPEQIQEMKEAPPQKEEEPKAPPKDEPAPDTTEPQEPQKTIEETPRSAAGLDYSTVPKMKKKIGFMDKLHFASSPDAVLLISAIDGRKTLGEIIKQTGADEKKTKEALDYLKNKGYLL